MRSIEAWPEDDKPQSVAAGESVGITLDEQIFVERGEIASHVENPPKLSNHFHARLFWLGHKPLTVGRRYKLKLLTQEAEVTVESARFEGMIHGFFQMGEVFTEGRRAVSEAAAFLRRVA